MADVTFRNSTGRGRNGWFTIATASVRSFPAPYLDQDFPFGYVHVNMVSKRPAFPGPIVLQLSPKDAKNLGEQLIQQSTDLLSGGCLHKPRQSTQ